MSNPLPHAETRTLIKSTLGADFTVGAADVPIYWPGAATDDGDADDEWIVATIARSALGRGDGAEVLLDVYVLNDQPAIAEDRVAEIVTALLDHLHRKSWPGSTNTNRIARTKAREVGPPPNDIQGAIRRQVVVEFMLDEEAVRIDGYS